MKEFDLAVSVDRMTMAIILVGDDGFIKQIGVE